jgi:tripartite-type tricarboxylate transporter receptor subunit TctC
MSRKRGTGDLGRRQVLKYAGTLAAGAVAAPFVGRIERAWAAWPKDRPVRIIVANSPGGPSDLTARFIAPVLQEALGQTFIVENRPGGGGTIGMGAVIRAEPDGYTLHLATSIWVIAPSLYTPPPYDPYKDLVPVVEIASSPSVFVAPAALGVKTLKDWVALARKDQDKFNIGTPPIGTTLHLGAELLKLRENLGKVAVVVFNGGGAAIQGILSNSVQLCSSSLAPAHPHIKSGTLTGLAILGDQRWPDLPDVPTAAEAGYKDFNFETYTSLMAPAKTPPEVVHAIEQAAIKGLQKPELREKIQKAGFIVQGKTAAEHAARIRREVPVFHDIIKTAGIKTK